MANDTNLLDLFYIIKAEAKRLGFSTVGITGLNRPSHFDIYDSWIKQGYQAEMHYLAADYAINFRANPAEYFPSGKSIIVVGYPYPNPISSNNTNNPENGHIAAYATIKDYHHTIPNLLKKLVATIKLNVSQDFHWKISSDTSPILEKELGQQAGLGWIGKNSCLINKDKGSFFLLGELLLSIELPPDTPVTGDLCGSCTRCIDACPTKCILPNRTINSADCISYQTIENKNSIPISIRGQMDNWIFGCDICQMVCPWNQKSTRLPQQCEDQILGFQLPLLKAIQLDQAQFDEEFSQSPVKRASHAGFIRNALAALGNIPPPGLGDALDALLTHPDAVVRQTAAWALWKTNLPDAVQSLQELAEHDPSPAIREEISLLLHGSHDGNPAP